MLLFRFHLDQFRIRLVPVFRDNFLGAKDARFTPVTTAEDHLDLSHPVDVIRRGDFSVGMALRKDEKRLAMCFVALRGSKLTGRAKRSFCFFPFEIRRPVKVMC